MNGKERENYLDVAKGIAIVLVVLGHTYSENLIKTWAYSFHLPIFFYISGCILSMKKSDISIKKSIKIKLKSLILPYFYFSFINFCIGISENYLLGKNKLTLDLILNKIVNIITFKGIEALWFLPCLFVAEIIFLLFIKYFKHKVIIIPVLVIASVLPFLNMNLSYNILFIQIMRILIGLVFLGAGYYSFSIVQYKNYNILLPIILLTVNIIIGKYNGFVDLYSLSLNNYFMYFSSAFCGILSILFICKKVVKNNIAISFLGINSLIIMATHLQIKIIVVKLVSIITKYTSVYIINDIILGFLVIVIIVLVEIPIIYIINRYFYFLMGKRRCFSSRNTVPKFD